MHTDEAQETAQARISELESENASLKHYRSVVEAELIAAEGFGRFSALVVLGPDLSVAIHRWLHVRSTAPQTFPVVESAEVIAAVVRRLIRVGVVAITLALVPTLLLFWQNILIRDQNLYFRAQIDKQQQQIEMQHEQDYRARKANLISTLYDRRDSCPQDQLVCPPPGLSCESSEQVCPVVSSPKARVEALKALIETERSYNRMIARRFERNALSEECRDSPRDSLYTEGCSIPADMSIDLRAIDLSGLVLDYQDFRNVRFQQGNLEGVNLLLSNLQGANLSSVNLREANLSLANFSGANLNFSTLSGCTINGTVFDGAQLSRADLNGCAFTGRDPSFERARFDATVCPDGTVSPNNSDPWGPDNPEACELSRIER